MRPWQIAAAIWGSFMGAVGVLVGFSIRKKGVRRVKFKILITAEIDAPVAELREELGIDSGDDLVEAVQQHLNDTIVDLGIEAGETNIGAVEVTAA